MNATVPPGLLRFASCAAVVLALASPARGEAVSHELGVTRQNIDSCTTLRNLRKPKGPELNPHPFLPIYEMRQLSDGDVKLLKRMLTNRCWADARELYFTNYQSDIPDWLVYIDAKGTVWQDLQHATTLTGAADTHRVLRDARFVYVIVFADSDLTPPKDNKAALVASLLSNPNSGGITASVLEAFIDSAKKAVVDSVKKAAGDSKKGASTDDTQSTPGIVLRRRVIAIQRDPILPVIIAGLGKTLGLSSPQVTPMVDSVETMQVNQVGAAKETLYVALGRFPIQDDARFELSIEPGPGQQFRPTPPADTTKKLDPPHLNRVLMNFANAQEHSFEAGVVPGLSYGRAIRTFSGTQITGESSGLGGNVYIAASANLLWFEEPIGTYVLHRREAWQRLSLGPIVGTNILRGTAGDELFAGAALGHLFEDAGVVAASDWVAEPEIRNGHTVNPRRARWLWGFYLML